MPNSTVGWDMPCGRTDGNGERCYFPYIIPCVFFCFDYQRRSSGPCSRFKTLFTSSCDCSTPAVVGYCVYKSCPVLSAGTLVSFSSELWHLCLKEANKNGWFSSVECLRFSMLNGNVEILRNATGIFFLSRSYLHFLTSTTVDVTLTIVCFHYLTFNF